jgi:hypothetical protein
VVGQTSPTRVDLLTLTERAFAQAADGGQTVLRRSVAGHPVEFQVAGPALADLLGLAFPEGSGGGPPELVVHAWDERATGVPYPVPEEAIDEFQPWRRRGPWVEVGTSGVRVIHQPFEDTLGVLSDGRGCFWTKDASSLPHYERASPLLHLLHWWLGDRDLHLVHAGAVGTPAGGALLVGPSGSGKSTSALACVGSPLGVVADDYAVVGLSPEPRAFSLYRTAKLERGHDRTVESLLHQLPTPSNPEPVPNDKSLYFLDRLEPEVPLRAIVVPRVTGQAGHRLIEIPRPRAFAAFAPSSILQLPGSGGRALAALRALLDLVPVYGLEVGTDLASIPTVIAEVCS